MPPAVHPDHHPHDDTHGGNAIHDNDREPVTVSDLLDAFYDWIDNDDSNERNQHYHDTRQRATDDVCRSFYNLTYALGRKREADAARDDLSPEERAEFDRRTT